MRTNHLHLEAHPATDGSILSWVGTLDQDRHLEQVYEGGVQYVVHWAGGGGWQASNATDHGSVWSGHT
jgi:hypothetical protein